MRNEKGVTGPQDVPVQFADMQRIDRYQEAWEVLTSSDFPSVTGREPAQPFIYRTLNLAEPGEHGRRRRVETPLFRPQILADRLDGVVREAVRQRVAATAVVPLARVDLVHLVPEIQILVMCHFLGMDVPLDDEVVLADLVEKTGIIGRSRSLAWSRRDRIEEAWEISEGTRDFVGTYVLPAIRAERSRQANGGQCSDTLLGALLANQDDSWDGGLIAREAIGFFSGGVMSTATAVLDGLGHVLDWLREHPEHADEALDQQSDFLFAVLAESLRLHPPTPVISRRAMRTGQLKSSGRTYVTGDEFALYVATANRDTSVFGADAAMFDPRRAVAHANRWGMSFGGGQHACIGQGLALGRRRHDGTLVGLEGTTVTILRALLQARVRLVPNDPPRLLNDTLKDVYATFPVILDRGPTFSDSDDEPNQPSSPARCTK